MKFLRRSFLAGLLAAALALGFAPRAAAQTFTIHPGDTVLFLGDSLTQFGWFSPTGGLVDRINAATTALSSTYQNIAAVHKLRGNGHAVRLQIPGGGEINVINRGVAGWSSNEIFNDKINIPALNPNAIILDVGINDATLGVSPSTYRSNLDGAIAYYQANIPGVEILFVSPSVDGELWTHIGPAFSANGFDPQVDAIIAQAQASCAAHSVLFVPMRPAALSYIIANGPAEPGASYGTLVDSSQKHPIVPSGQLWMCDQVMPYVTVAP